MNELTPNPELETTSAVAAARKRPAIPVRKVKFNYKESGEAMFPHSAMVKHLLHVLSMAFPDGEQFFVDSVRPFRKKLANAGLREEVRAFIGQEAQHGAQHDEYNDFLAKSSPIPTKRIRKVIKRVTEFGTRNVPAILRLSGTAAAEHFTSILAEQLLANPTLGENADAEHYKLWMWHAVEETEHKAVAFDVFQAVGGSYWNRVTMLAGMTLIAIPGISAAVLIFTAADGKLFSKKDWAGFIDYGFGKRRGIFSKAIPAYLRYYQRDFHPWKYDNSELVAQWKARFEQDVMIAQVGVPAN